MTAIEHSGHVVESKLRRSLLCSRDDALHLQACNGAFISHAPGERGTCRKNGSGAGNQGLTKKQASCQPERIRSPSKIEFSLPPTLWLTCRCWGAEM